MSQRSDLDERLAFLQFGELDRERLAGLRPVLEKHASAFVSAFYRHLLSFGPTRELLHDPEVKERLLAVQRDYLLSLAGPAFDADFVAERRHIGEVHDRVGLVPRWYLGAYAFYLSTLTPLIYEAFEHDPRRALESLVALQKLLALDQQLAMEAYIDRQHRELEYLAEELAQEGRRLAQDYEQRGVALRETEQRARAAEELASVATLVAGLAHEIGTPLGVIQGHAKLLEPAVQGEEAAWRVQTIEEQITRIRRIIETLLNIARPGKTRRQPVALEPLIETSLSFVKEKLARRGIEVQTQLEAVPSVLGDPERLQQLFLNLFLNAADAMLEGGVLRVDLGCESDEIAVRIADTGAGISADAIEKIFEPFYTTKPTGQGHGLGLMVAKGIASDHGGALGVSSRPGEGTEFRVCLPVALAHPE